MLEKHSFFKNLGLTPQDFSELEKHCQKIKEPQGKMIFRQDDPADAVYFTTTAQINVTNLVTQKLEKVLYTIPKDSIFGEMTLLDGGTRSASAIVIVAGEIIKLPRDSFLNIFDQNPKMSFKLMRGLYEVVVKRLRHFNNVFTQNVRWGMDVSGACKLEFSELVAGETPVEFSLSTGHSINGTIVKAIETSQGFEFTVRTPDRDVCIIPYRSVSCIRVGKASQVFYD